MDALTESPKPAPNAGETPDMTPEDFHDYIVGRWLQRHPGISSGRIAATLYIAAETQRRAVAANKWP